MARRKKLGRREETVPEGAGARQNMSESCTGRQREKKLGKSKIRDAVFEYIQCIIDGCQRRAERSNA